MSNIPKANGIAQALRQEPHRLSTNDWITKSIRLKRQYKAEGIPAKVAVCIGLARTRWFGHGWGEVEGQGIETSRPPGSSGVWGIVPVNIRPLFVLKG